jgi:SNF2 family DNA or RNA helicase
MIIRIDESEHYFLIRAPEAISRRVSISIPCRVWNRMERVWMVPRTVSAAGQLAACLDELLVSAADSVQTTPGFDRLRQVAGSRARSRAGELDGVAPPDLRYPNRQHQVRAFNFMRFSDALYLAWEMGSGKTLAVMAMIEGLAPMRSVFVGCPLSVVFAWRHQWDLHYSGQRAGQLYVLEGTAKRKLATLKAAFGEIDAGRRAVVVCNYESAWREPLGAAILGRDWDLVVADESQRIKGATSTQSDYFGQLGQRAYRRMCLSGTPMPNSPLDLWAQLRFLDRGLLHASYSAFRMRYGVMGGFQGRDVVAYRDLDVLRTVFGTVADRVMASEVCDLPALSKVVVPVELPAAARTTYQEMSSNFVAFLGNDDKASVSMTVALTKLLRLQQAAGGWVHDDAHVLHEIHTAKQDAFSDWIDGIPLEEPLVVFARFTAEIHAVVSAVRKAGREAYQLADGVNDFPAWFHGKGGGVLVANIQSGGLGLDMTRASQAFFFSIGFSMGDYLQAVARLHREGQARPVRCYHAVAQRTVDEVVYEAIADKRVVAGAVLGDPRSEDALLPLIRELKRRAMRAREPVSDRAIA